MVNGMGPIIVLHRQVFLKLLFKCPIYMNLYIYIYIYIYIERERERERCVYVSEREREAMSGENRYLV